MHRYARWVVLCVLTTLLAGPVSVVQPHYAAADDNLALGQSAVVTSSDGAGVSIRTAPDASADSLGVVPDGTTIVVLDGPLSGPDGALWFVVSSDALQGYVPASQMTGIPPVAAADEAIVETPVEEPAPTENVPTPNPLGTVIAVASIGGTNGVGAACYSQPSYDAAVIVIFSDGETVELTSDPTNGWQPVNCAGQGGWVESVYVIVVTPTTEPEPTDVPAQPTVEITTEPTQNATVEPTETATPETPESTETATPEPGPETPIPGATPGSLGGLGVDSGFAIASSRTRCFSSPSSTSELIVAVNTGDRLALRAGSVRSWQAVTCNDRDGFVKAKNLKIDTASSPTPTPKPTKTATPVADDAGTSAIIGTAKVVKTNGDGVRMRASASSTGTVIMVVPEGATVKVRSSSKGVWTAVRYASRNGFIHRDFLSNIVSGGDLGVIAVGDRVKTTALINVRSGPSMSASVLAVAPSGTVVKVLGGRNNGFYPINWDGLKGWMHSDYLKETTDALSPRNPTNPTPTPTPTPTPPAGGGNSQIVNYAMRYLGYPYVWATHGPNSFDCSGFTYWVVLNTLGRNISPGLWAQIGAGTPVGQGELQPGDLVFFQNTYTWGLSHVGIYIGGGQFIHAQNEATGVVISDLGSTYYSTRWYGARRLT